MKIANVTILIIRISIVTLYFFELFCALFLLPALCLAVVNISDPTLKLTREEISWLNKNKDSIRYSPNPYWPPCDYMEDGEHKGIVSDYIKIFEQKLGITFNRVYYDDWASFYNGLMTGEYDLAGAAPKTEERQKVLVFTEPFLITRLAILTNTSTPALNSLNDLNSMKIAGITGHSSLDYVKSKYPGVKNVPCKDDVSVLLKVSSGAVDGAVADYMLASYLIDKYSITNIRYAAELDFYRDLRFAINKEKAQFRSILDKVLASITEKEQHEIYHKWVHVKMGSNPGFIDRNINIIIGLFALVLLALFFAILLNRYLQKQIARHTKDLESTSSKLQESLHLFQSVFEVANVGKSIVSPTGKIRANKAFAHMLGYELAEIQGKTWRELTLPEDIPLTEQFIAPLHEGHDEYTRFEKRYLHKDGKK